MERMPALLKRIKPVLTIEVTNVFLSFSLCRKVFSPVVHAGCPIKIINGYSKLLMDVEIDRRC